MQWQVLGVLILLQAVAAAPTLGNQIERGRAIAAARCGLCHATGASDRSPHAITPPMRSLNERFPIPMLAEAMRTNVISGHDEMPMFEFNAGEMDALMRYIDSLSPADRRYVPAGPSSRP